MAAYAQRMRDEGRFGETEELLTRIGLGEYLAQIFGGIPMNQGEIVRPPISASREDVARLSQRGRRDADRRGQHARQPRRARRADRRGARGRDRRPRPRRDLRGDPRRDAPLRRRRGRAPRAGLAPRQRLYPARGHRRARRHGRVRPDDPRGIRRHGARQGRDVRRLRGAVARLYRRRLARHALGDRRRADPGRRHGGAEAQIAAQDRQRRDPADRRVHRAQHRLRPREPAHPRDPRRRRLCRQRRQDLDHPSRARRPDDAAGAHQPRRARLQGPVDVSGRKAARDRRRSVSRPRACRAARSRCSAIAA